MANTFELIESYTVGSGGAADITFTSIPSTFTDLCVKFSLRTDHASVVTNIELNLNGVNTGLSGRRIYGAGSGTPASDSNALPGFSAGTSSTSNTFANGEIYIPNYAGSSYKSVSGEAVTENNATAAYALLSATLWSSTAAITSLKLVPNAGSGFLQYSTAYLYGVKNA